MTSRANLFFGILACTSLLWSSAVSSQSIESSCLNTQSALDYWRPIRATADSPEHSANQLSRELVSCLNSANSELRDGIGYELFTYWLRNDKLSTESKTILLQSLSSNLQQGGDDRSLSRSFSALVLSEVMRADNQSSFMSQQDRLDLLNLAVTALSNESDFRGLVEGIGWVHPIAHLADVLWRFSLHSALDEEQARLIFSGVRSKAGPAAVSYTFNEGDRLARPIAILIRRQALPADEFVAWLANFDTPESMDSWSDAFASVEGMAELHNTKLFIRALSDQLLDLEIDVKIQAKLDELVKGLTSLV